MSKRPRNADWRDSIIAGRVWAAARDRHGRTERYPTERVRSIGRERIVGDGANDQEETSSAPSIDDERAASRAGAAEARRFFDRLLAVAMSQQQAAPQQTDAEVTAPAVE
jgi:hypothetical protein